MAENTPGDMSEAHFLTIAEVAAKMRVSKMTVYRLVEEKAIRSIRIGRTIRIPESAVDEYLSRDS